MVMMGMTEKQYGIHNHRYQFRVITNDKEEISRIFFEEKVTGEIIEGRGNITRWINKLVNENGQLKQDKKRLIGFLHRYKGVDVEDVDEEVLSKEYLDEWGELYHNER